jgi:hypothetical protein
MAKIHTKIKRKYGLTTSFRHKTLGAGKKKTGPRTFISEESAKKWASENKLIDGSYTLKLVKKNKRFQIVKIE